MLVAAGQRAKHGGDGDGWAGRVALVGLQIRTGGEQLRDVQVAQPGASFVGGGDDRGLHLPLSLGALVDGVQVVDPGR
ncbi:hypothetical protein E1166_03380 [Micromonospora sp. KC213]|nr:hypothetical protein E1166_03380 [Micromonospora sp. KC213]